MNTALSLLRHAFGLVVEQPLVTLKAVAPALVLMGGVGVITAVTAPELLVLDPARPDLESIQSAKLAVVLLLVFVLSYALMAILWHRHTLSSARKPQPYTAGLIGGYLWRVLALALIQMVAGLALVAPLVIASNTGAAGPSAPSLLSMLLTTFVTQLLLLWLSLRLSLILPAAALGRPISMLLSWRYTLPLSRPLWGVAAVLALINTGLAALTAHLDMSQPAFALALELPIYVIEGLMVFSVLTTLYSRQVQRNSLDGI